MKKAMSESYLFEEIAEQQGWTDATQVEVLLRYIENQASPEAFQDFLNEQVAAELSLDPDPDDEP